MPIKDIIFVFTTYYISLSSFYRFLNFIILSNYTDTSETTFLFSFMFWRFNYGVRYSCSSFKVLYSNFHKVLYSSFSLRYFLYFASIFSFLLCQVEFEFPLLANQRLLIDPFSKPLNTTSVSLSLFKVPIILTIASILGKALLLYVSH